MKLKFNKTEEGDISAVILDDTKQEAFSYIKMIAALLNGQSIECEYGEGISSEEQEQINNLNEAIWKKVHPEEENGEMSLFC